jgi:hypothetical protein
MPPMQQCLKKRKKEKDWSLRSVRYAVLCANATMLEQNEKDWSLCSVSYAVLVLHVHLFVRVSP